MLLLGLTGSIATGKSTVSQILDGDVNRYPFDVFLLEYSFYAFISPSNSSYGTPIPISAAVSGAVQGFKIDTAFQGLRDDGSGVKITFTVRRSAVTKVFSIIISLGTFYANLWRLGILFVWFAEECLCLQ